MIRKIGHIIMLIGMVALLVSVLLTYTCVRFVDCDMILRHHWGLGVGHTYSHVPCPSDENQPSTAAGNKPAAQATSSTRIPIPSSRIHMENRSTVTKTIEDDPDAEFLLPYWDGTELEWEIITDSTSEEEGSGSDADDDDDIQRMYSLYDDGADSEVLRQTYFE
jgi:hypothetical protein